MDSERWDGEAGRLPPVIELPNGDVWVGTAEGMGGRRFRRHLGHVVEVFEGGRIRRVGPGLRHARPWLLADGPLEMVIERALLDVDGDGRAWPEPADAPAALVPSAHAPSPGLFGRIAALLHRGGTALHDEAPSPPSPWRDTMPWTHPR